MKCSTAIRYVKTIHSPTPRHAFAMPSLFCHVGILPYLCQRKSEVGLPGGVPGLVKCC